MGSQLPTLKQPTFYKYFILDYQYTKVWVRKVDNAEIFEQYQINAKNQDNIQRYTKMISTRLSEPYISNLIYFSQKQTNNSCDIATKGILLIERIPFRLCQFRKIPYSQTLSIIKQSLQGFNSLYNTYGLFKVQSTMIGFDKNYCVKVWHHTDLGAPQPQNPFCHNIIMMMKNIINCIEKCSEYPRYCERFSDYLERNNRILYNYQKCIQYLKEYCQQYGFVFIQRFPNIQNYFQHSIFTRRRNDKFSFKTNSIVDPVFQTSNQSINKVHNNSWIKSSSSFQPRSYSSSNTHLNKVTHASSIIKPISHRSNSNSSESPYKYLNPQTVKGIYSENITNKASTKPSIYTNRSNSLMKPYIRFNTNLKR